MKLTRREFGQKSLFGMLMLWVATGFSATFLTGCPQMTLAQAIAAIQKWVPTVVNAAQNIINLLGSIGVIPIGSGTAAAALITMITGIVTSILSTITEYENAPPASKATLLDKIRELLSSIADNLSGFVNGLNLSGNAIVKTIGVLLSVIISTISGFLNIIPVSGPTAKTLTISTSVTVGGQKFAIKPQAQDRAGFLNVWNKNCKSLKHPEACIYEANVVETEKKLKA